jgi:hypothetical protein
MFIQLCPYLRKFLWERNLWWRFQLNLWLCAYSFKDYIRIRKSLAITKPYAIALAFDFEVTSEGERFWASINRKWEIQYAYLLSGGIIEPYIPTQSDDDEPINPF